MEKLWSASLRYGTTMKRERQVLYVATVAQRDELLRVLRTLRRDYCGGVHRIPARFGHRAAPAAVEIHGLGEAHRAHWAVRGLLPDGGRVALRAPQPALPGDGSPSGQH